MASHADKISLGGLFEHVSHSLGPHLAANLIREKWVSREVKFWVHWTNEHVHARDLYGTSNRYGVEFAHREEPALPSLLIDFEKRGLGIRLIIGLSEHGIYVGRDRTAYLFASRSDAAKFWPWSDEQSSDKPGRRSSKGAKVAFRWEDALIEAAAFILENDLPKTQDELVSHISTWFGDKGPSDTQIKAHIGPLFRRAKTVLGR